jgi:hypothetical protein
VTDEDYHRPHDLREIAVFSHPRGPWGSFLAGAAMILPIDAIQFNPEENLKAEYGWSPAAL